MKLKTVSKPFLKKILTIIIIYGLWAVLGAHTTLTLSINSELRLFNRSKHAHISQQSQGTCFKCHHGS